jgi:hypothetical protein
MKTLSVSFATLLAKVVDAGSTRYALSGAHVVPHAEFPDEAFAAATNTKVLVISKLKGVVTGTHLVPHTALPQTAAECGCETVLNGERYEFTKQTRKGPEMRFEKELEGRFPAVENVLPQLGCAEYERLVAVTLDPQLLLNLALALGVNDEASGITLLLPVQLTEDGELSATQRCGSPVACVANGNIGLIMPMSPDSPAEHERAVETYESVRQSYVTALEVSRHSTDSNKAGHDLDAIVMAVAADVIASKPALESPVAVVSQDVADAFDMHELPHTEVLETHEESVAEADEPEFDLLDLDAILAECVA